MEKSDHVNKQSEQSMQVLPFQMRIIIAIDAVFDERNSEPVIKDTTIKASWMAVHRGW